MKIIAVDIDKSKAIFGTLQGDASGNITPIESDFKFAILEDDKDSAALKVFQSTIYNFFEELQADRIVILARQMKGRFKAASVSFKIEALLQAYTKVNVEFVSPQTLKAYYKKHEVDMQVEYKYQENALKLGCYVLRNEVV
jgi:hypothetical protein